MKRQDAKKETVDKIMNLIDNDHGAREAFADLIFGNGRKSNRKNWNKKTSKQKLELCSEYKTKVCSWDGIQYTDDYLSKVYNISLRKLRKGLD